MVVEHHHERAVLNARARALLFADGTLRGPEVEMAGAGFAVGDEVIAKKPDRQLRAVGASGADHVKNGSRGTVTAVHDQYLVVEFIGKGKIRVPRRYVEQEIAPGLTGALQHAYCVTSYAAQGETYEAARHLATDSSSRQGVYVGLSRGRRDVKLYAVRRQDLVPDALDDDLPILREDTTLFRALSSRLISTGEKRLVHETDPEAGRIMVRPFGVCLDRPEDVGHPPHRPRGLPDANQWISTQPRPDCDVDAARHMLRHRIEGMAARSKDCTAELDADLSMS
jgi:hypothetical protein